MQAKVLKPCTAHAIECLASASFRTTVQTIGVNSIVQAVRAFVGKPRRFIAYKIWQCAQDFVNNFSVKSHQSHTSNKDVHKQKLKNFCRVGALRETSTKVVAVALC